MCLRQIDDLASKQECVLCDQTRSISFLWKRCHQLVDIYVLAKEQTETKINLFFSLERRNETRESKRSVALEVEINPSTSAMER